MKTNTRIPSPVVTTHGGAKTHAVSPEKQLRKILMTCMLWEDNFYEDGKSVADRIAELVAQIPTGKVAQMAIDSRKKMKLRHAPLLVLAEIAKKTDKAKYKRGEGYSSLKDDIGEVINRPDEMGELISICWRGGRSPLASQVKRGLAETFKKFNEYQLAKYNRDSAAISLRDVLFLTHPKPEGDEQAALWKRLIAGTMETPDTWEVALSDGADKKETFTRLLVEKKMGAMAILRNLRNMYNSGVDKLVVKTALDTMKVERILPYRFIAAARAVPQWEDIIEPAMLRCLEGASKLPGNTIILIDVSGSMEDKLSAKSDLTRLDAACGLAVLARELCEAVEIFTFSSRVALVPTRRGFALVDAIRQSQPHASTQMGEAVDHLRQFSNVADRLIMVTDEQSTSYVPSGPFARNYSINVAPYKNGVANDKNFHLISGWSEAVFDYISVFETEED